MRDWSSEGSEERRQSYGRICNVLQRRKPPWEGAVKVLVPGCGLGRLPYDLAKLGYQAEVMLSPACLHGLISIVAKRNVGVRGPYEPEFASQWVHGEEPSS